MNIYQTELIRFRKDSERSRRDFLKRKYWRMNFHTIRNTVTQVTAALAIGLALTAQAYA